MARGLLWCFRCQEMTWHERESGEYVCETCGSAR